MAWQHTYIPLQLAEVEVCSTGVDFSEDGEQPPPDAVDDDMAEDAVLLAEPVDICSLAGRPSLDEDDTFGWLRPRKRPLTQLESLAGASPDQSSTAGVAEDRIFHVPFLMELINEFYSLHSVDSPGCTPVVTMPADMERKYGLGYWEALRCQRCGFTTPQRKLYEEGERVPGHTRGPRPPKKNLQLVLGLTKIPVGSTAIHQLFTSVELSLPTRSSIHNLATGMAGPLVSLAQQALADNRRRLRAVMEMRGCQVEDGEPVAIAAAADGCFNNPCYKGFHQKSTQAALNVREQETEAKMLIGFGFANKFGKDGEASAYPKSQPIGNAEEWLAGRVTLEMYQCNESPLLLKALVTDGSGQIYRGAKSATQSLQPDFNVEHQDCMVHASRRQRASVFRAKLSSQLVTGQVGFTGKVSQEAQKAFCTVLSKTIASRCAGELSGARGLHPTDDSKFLEAVLDAKDNILDCFSGNHTKCFGVSFVCPCSPVGSDHTPSYLPRKTYLLLTLEDRVELGEVLDSKLSEDKAMKQRYLRSTNSVEAFHRCMHKSLPKSLTFKTLAEMRAYSAVHTSAVGGLGESLARLGQHFGVAPRSGGEAAHRLMQIDRQADADKRRQQSDAYRNSRNRASTKTVSKRVEKMMADTSPSVHLPHEHPYIRSEDVSLSESMSD
ncbi:hypothetical protein Bbelb_277550 [Branchiostoma belcheri]|nr:hypothetical protein Bbelb_277550 [Branchiostoma belcheri]